MKKQIEEREKNEEQPFFRQSEFEQIHDQMKDQAIVEVNISYSLHHINISLTLYYINSIVKNRAELAQLIENKLTEDINLRFQLS